MADINWYKEQARRADEQYRAGVKALRDRGDLSDAGKLQEAQRLEAQRAGLVASLQKGAREELATAGAAAQKTLARAAAAREGARRELLGAAVYADLVRRRIAQLTPAQLSAWANEPHDATTHALIVEYGALDLAQRIVRSKGQDTDAAIAQRELMQVDTAGETAAETEARRVADWAAHADEFVAELDGKAYRERLGATFNLNPEHVPTPM